jgi:lincosamide nucleotidyltransferase A/C/D/E
VPARGAIRGLYQWLEMTRASRLLQTRAVQSYRARTRGVRDMGVGEAMTLLESIERAAGRIYLVGGWGVDALVGRQTRLHDDLDLAFEARPEAEERILEVLGRWGYQLCEEHLVVDGLFPVRRSLRDASGHGIDLLPFRPYVTSDAGGATADDGGVLPTFQPTDFVAGELRDRGRRLKVQCLRAELQLASRERHDLRPSDHHDIAHLRRHVGQGSDAR